MTTHREKYHLPVKPEDPEAEYLTLQETAYIFRCSVKTIERRALSMGLGSKIGARKVLSRADRAAMYELRRDGTPARVPAQRRRKPPVKRTAAKASTPRIAA